MEAAWAKEGESKMKTARTSDEMINTIVKRTSCFEIKYSVPISTFDHSAENFLSDMDAISELSGGTKVENFETTEIERFKAMIIFLSEWKQFFFCEWMPFHYKSKTVNFTYQHESTEEKYAISGIELPLFSSAAVPKLMEKLPGTSSAFDNDDFLLHVGGSVWTFDWCPRLHGNDDSDFKCEYLAIAAHPNDSKYHKIGERLSGRGFIQIWCFLHLGEEELLNCRDEYNEKVKGDICEPKSRGRPKKAAFQITNACNGASNSDHMEGSLNGFDEAYEHGGNPIEGPRKRRGRPPVVKTLKPRGRPRKCSISSSKGCAVVQGVSDLNGPGKLLPCSGTSTQEGFSQFHVHDLEASVLLNHVDTCQEIIAVTEKSLPENSSLSEGIALPRLVLTLAHNGKVAWDMKWRPLDTADSNCKHHLGYLAVLLGDGSLEVWEVPVHSLVKHLYVSSHIVGTDPRFLKLHPVFKCSRINFGVRQSIPLALEWSPSASRDLILVGCHDGTVALWKFSSQHSSQDTRPLLCFTADTVPIRSLAWAPEDSDPECSNLIVTAGHEGMKFWDLRDPYRPLWEFSPVQRAVLGLDWLKYPRCIVIAYEDGTLRTLSLTKIANDTPVTGEPFPRTRHQGVHCQSCSMFAIWSVQVSRSSGLAAYCSSDGCTRYFQLTPEFVEKDSSRYRKPHFLCCSFEEEGETLRINTPLSRTPLPKHPFVPKKDAYEAKPTDSSVKALCWHDGEETCTNGNEKKRTKEGKHFASFPPKGVAMHKVRWNTNQGSERWLCYGGAAGIVRCQVIAP